MSKGSIPDSEIQEIRDRTSIEDIIGDFVELKPAGQELRGLSPFKDEKTPSFFVNPAKGMFYCFSTSQGGDVFKFLMLAEQMTFPEAVEYCAQKIGYQIRYEGGTPGSRYDHGSRQRLFAANEAAMKFYEAQLSTPEAQPARELLKGRSFSKKDAEVFHCGYAPDGWDTMTKQLLKSGFTFEELEAAGLSKMGVRGPIDRFHRRLVWPIRKATGDVLGFGARKLFDDDKLGKYMNTPETTLYKKSQVLFGLDLARTAIAKNRRCIVVEGYTDVMAMHAAGLTETVAACGTAFGDSHLELIRRFLFDGANSPGQIIYTFDGDEAGQKAALRAFEKQDKFQGQTYVCIAPDNMDPCDLRMKRGEQELRDLITRKMPLFEFVIKSLLAQYELAQAGERRAALERAVPVVASIRDQVLRNEYARQLAGWLGWTNIDEVIRMVAQESRRPIEDSSLHRRQATRFNQTTAAAHAASVERARRSKFVRPDPRSPRLLPERESLKVALQYPQASGARFDAVPPAWFTDPLYRAVKEAIDAAGGCTVDNTGADWMSKIIDGMNDVLAGSFVSELAVEKIKCQQDGLVNYAGGMLDCLELAVMDNSIAQLSAALARRRMSDDEKGYGAMISRLYDLQRRARDLRDKMQRPPAG